jgi:hypothetical protein
MILLFVSLALLILNPYTVFGPLGYYTALPFIGLSFLNKFKHLKKTVLYLFLVCIVISFIGSISSILHGIPQFGHPKVAISILLYFLVGIGLFNAFGRRTGVDEFLIACLCIGVLNSAVILLQVQFPEFRAIVESVFVESGNIDWTEGFRYRGLASGGGASLSVLSAFMVYIALYLYTKKKINLHFLVASLIILILSIFFIGRTGTFLIVVAFAINVLTQGWRSIRNILILMTTFIFISFYGLKYVEEFLIQSYDEAFYRYSLGFILEGKQGITDEGTVGMVAEFLATVPTELPEMLIGYGFYGAGDFRPWTDSGYARMFLSVGFLFGFVFYCCAFYIFKKSARGKQLLFWPLIALLAIAEAKEGLLFAGYSSRLLFILMGFWTAQSRGIVLTR